MSKRERELIEKIHLLQNELENERADRRSLHSTRQQNVSITIVTNRLPISIWKDPVTNKWCSRQSSGGLVSAVLGTKNRMKWIGCVEVECEEEEHEEIIEYLTEFNCVPVFIPKDLYNDYYNGFSNDVLWPVFHYVHLPINTLSIERSYWKAYYEANRRLCNVVLKNTSPHETIWVHDYHLMLLPKFLREARPNAAIGWFLHTPFPNSDIFKTLSCRADVLKGVLASDLIGFHIYNYVRNFKHACVEVLGCNSTSDSLKYNGKVTMVGAFPIGIDVEKFDNFLRRKEFSLEREKLRQRYGDVKIIIGIDRLDYIKGIMHKLLAIEKFLEQNSEWTNKVTYIQIAVPTRKAVPEYQRFTENVHELVGRINGKFSNLTHVPIHYLDQSISFSKLVALYNFADACLITSLRDGMNLVSYEFVASQNNDPGVLILSEFVGAAQSLGAGSIQINPWNIEEVAKAILTALQLGPEEKKKLFEYGKNYVAHHSSQKWAESYLGALKQSWENNNLIKREMFLPRQLDKDKIKSAFINSKKRCIFCGVFGTLTDIDDKQNRISKSTMEALIELASQKNTDVVVSTSHGKDFFEQHFKNAPLVICAENGFWLKDSTVSDDWIPAKTQLNLEWFDEAEKIIDYFVERTPSSKKSQFHTVLGWDYSECEGDFVEQQARDLVSNLRTGPLVNFPTEVLHDSLSKFVKVRLMEFDKPFSIFHALDYMHKRAGNRKREKSIKGQRKKRESCYQEKQSMGRSLAEALDAAGYDFMLCIGSYIDSDQEVFSLLSTSHVFSLKQIENEKKIFTISVGKRKSLANEYVESPKEVENLFKLLCEID